MVEDFYEFLRSRIVKLPDLSASSRGVLYRKSIAAVEAFIARSNPPLSGQQQAEIRDLLDAAFKRIEAEFAQAREEGSYAPEWAIPPKPEPPPEPPQAESPPATGSAMAQAGQASLVEAEPDAAELTLATPPQDGWDDIIPPGEKSLRPNHTRRSIFTMLATHVRIVGALVVHTIKTMAGQEKPAYLWLAVEPVLQVGLIVSLYYMFGRTIVYSMPAVPFAVIGVGAWVTFRTMLMRLGSGLGREYALCFFPGVARLDVYLAKAIFFGLSYFLASMIMLWVADALEIAPFDMEEPFQFLGLWLLIWLFGFGFAMIMNYIFALIPVIRRVMLVIMRGLYLVSAVVVVTEQFAEEDKVFFLWNPLVHGMQLLRASYFHEYSSDDASLAYFLTWTLVILLLGLICERAQRRRDITP